jgi:DNA-binding CsgD family transcriptional regulator
MEASMGISISTALSTSVINTANQSATAAVAPSTQNTAAGDTDTVKLTVAQQVYDLYIQGQTVPQIATGLNLTVELVNSYLGLSATT